MPSPSPASTRRGFDPLEILVEASDIAAGHTLNLDELLQALADLIRKVIDYQLFAVLLSTEKGDALRIRFSIGYGNEVVRSLRIQIGEGISGTAAQQRKPVIVNDVSRDSRYIAAVDNVRSEMAVPLIARGKIVGVIDLQSSELSAFSDHQQNILELIGSRFSLAIDAARLYRATLRQNRTLRTLTEITQEFSQILRLEGLLSKVSSSVRSQIPYDAFSVLLLDPEAEALKHYYGVRFDQRVQWESIPLGKGIVGAAAHSGQPVLVRDTKRDPRYVELVEGIRSELAVPLIAKDEVIGVLNLESKRVAAFSKAHLQLLSLLAPWVATAIENARLYEQVRQNEERMERDLTAARELQKHLLAESCPSCQGLEIAARNEAATEVTGDLYEFFPFDDGVVGILLGDVSGKGVAAALYGALFSGLVRNLVGAERSPAQLLSAANDALLVRKIETRYLTALYALWHRDTRTLRLANAGQPRPFLLQRAEKHLLAVTGIPLGLLPGSKYEDLKLTLSPGDTLVLFSDGITESEDVTRKQYGDERLPQILEQHPGAPASELLDRIFEDVEEFTAGGRKDDDCTVIVVRATE